MEDETKSAISDMQSATSLHEGRQYSGDSSDMENRSQDEANNTEAPPSKFGLVIDDSKLEKTIQLILDRLNTLEVNYWNSTFLFFFFFSMFGLFNHFFWLLKK